ncbi:MAG: NifB/NifX family molybdenum-iron cluster-binding protein [Marinilabiliales bacterium]|nr:NifB/NifX family molybdenum-iron cluster-binding protein [Marinilabiliales bacterium]
MKVALPVRENNQIDGHFGHCAYFEVVSWQEDIGKIESKRIPSLQGCGCKSGIAGVLAAEGVTLLIAGGIGNGAVNVLNRNGIEVIRGIEGDVLAAVEKYFAGELADSGESCSAHSHHASGEGGHHACSH